MKVTVIGSINMDLVVYSDEIPGVGETVMGNVLLQNPGGKGANQAVALAKLGVPVTFLGRVGSDAYGEELRRAMTEVGVDTDRIDGIEGNSGIAVIHVDKQGNNNIVVIGGANDHVSDEYIRANQSVFQAGDYALFQLEIPLASVKTGLELAHQAGTKTILNPAPAAVLDDELLRLVDILIPNEHELARISGSGDTSLPGLIDSAQALLSTGVGEIIVTLGERGVLYVNQELSEIYPAKAVKVVDSTAAGDSFIGGFLAGLIRGDSVVEAIAYGQAAASITIQRPGAQNSLPTKTELSEMKP